MGWFGKKKVVDLSERYNSAKKFRGATKPAPVETDNNLGFLGDIANNNSASASNDISWDNDAPQQNYAVEKRQKLAKRFLDMTEKIEEISNQIYHLNQRMEVLEKKMKIRFD